MIKYIISVNSTLPRPIFLLIITFIFFSFTLPFHEANKKKTKRNTCSEFTEIYKDKVTGLTRYIAKEKITLMDFEQKNQFDLVWFKNREDYTLAFKANKKLCFENDVAVSFHLLEGKVVTVSSSHIANCESLMTVQFEEEEDQDKKLGMIQNSEVVGISFTNKNANYKLKLYPKDARLFKDILECLTKQ